jgi:fermentation-respiration switch protein FrsA (DUF1100 family)
VSAVRSVLVSLLAVAAVCVALWWALAFVAQRALLFPRSAIQAGAAPDLERLGAERLWLESDGGRSEAWLLPARTGGAPGPLIVYAHGNGELIDHWAEAFEPARALGVSALLVEYPGYGRSAGTPSEASIRAALVAAYDRAAARGDVDVRRIVGWGRSLGGGAVCALAHERRLAALVLESTFTSVRSMAAGFFVPGFLVRDPFDNLALVRGFERPLLLLHGERDEVVAVAHAYSLHAASRGAELQLLPCGHNDCARPWDAVLGFLAAHGLLAQGGEG